MFPRQLCMLGAVIAVTVMPVHRGAMAQTRNRLDAARVEASPLLMQTADRYIYDVSKDTTAYKTNMLDIMPNIPELRVGASRGKLQYKDTPVAKILIDGVEHGMINVHRQYPMEFIKADHMRTIELILPGSAEYNNTEPILVIKLRKALPYGFAGELSAQAATNNVYDPHADVVIYTPIVGFGVHYGFSYAKRPTLNDIVEMAMLDDMAEYGSTVSAERNWAESIGHNISLNIFRDFLNGKLKVTGRMSTSYSESSLCRESIFDGFDDEKNLKVHEENSFREFAKSPFRINGALRLSGNFGPSEGVRSRYIGKYRWQVDYSYDDRMGNSSSTSLTASKVSHKEHRVIGNIKLPRIANNPFGIGVNAQAGYYNRNVAEHTAYSLLDEVMDYRQHVAFANGQALGSGLRGKMMYGVTLNVEYLTNDGSFKRDSEFSPLDYHEFNVIPGLWLNMRFNRHSMGVSYRRTVKRPDVSQINPYVRIYDAYNTTSGNPALRGEKTDFVSLDYVYGFRVRWIQNVRFNVSSRNTSNAISRMTEVSQEGIMNTTYANIGRKSTVSASFEAYLIPVKSLSVNFNTAYSHMWYVLPNGRINSYGSPKMSLSVSWHPEWFDMNGGFRLSALSADAQTTKYQLNPDLYFSISRYFQKIHLGVSADISDILHWGGNIKDTIQGRNFIRYSTREREGVSACFTIYWHFGHFNQVSSIGVAAYDM